MPRGGRVAAPTMKLERPAGELSDLLRAVAGGDADALAEMYRRLESSIYAFAMSRLGDREQAAEVLHEVMLEVWRKADTFRGRSRTLTWILGIARHKILEAQRRSKRWRPEPPPDEDVPDTTAPAPFERVDRGERRDAVRGALAALSDDHREVIHLAFYQDLSYPEISRLLDIPEGTVKTRVFYAKKAMRRRLAGRLEGGAT
jgi:RNA polymerase sigma-70 factor (ECF subfamily)